MTQTQDYSQVYDFLYRIERRISSLEKDAEFTQKSIDKIDKEVKQNFDSLKNNISKTKEELRQIKAEFETLIKKMTLLSKDLKSTIQKDSITQLNLQLEELKFEEYVTQNELKRGI